MALWLKPACMSSLILWSRPSMGASCCAQAWLARDHSGVPREVHGERRRREFIEDR
jgi:hypothetical protein